MQRYRKLTMICAAAVLTLGLAACGGGDSDTAMEPPPPPPPTPYEMAIDNIAAATTAADAQAAYDAVKDDVTAAQGDALQDAVDMRIAALATMARAAMQQAALMTAAGNVDTSGLMTQADIDAAQMAVDALQAAIDAAVDVADTSMYETMVTNANTAIGTAQGNVNTENRMAMQQAALDSADTALHTALDAIAGQPTQAQIDDAEAALAAFNQAIADAVDIADTSGYADEANYAAGRIASAKRTLMANNEAAEEEQRKAEEAARAAMAVTASKLYAGIGAAPLTGHTVAVDGTSGVWSVDPNDVAPANLANQALEADEDTEVAARHGWEGSRHTASGDSVTGTYEAVIYSHIGDPTVTEGMAFNAVYTLDATTGETTAVTGLTGHVTSRVASPSFDQDAGTKTFELPTNTVRVVLAGSYQGVPGTYYCTPTGGGTDCSAAKADMGFTLAGGTWTFKPTNPTMKLMDTSAPDGNYASYGWWLHKAANDGAFTASAFAVYRGTDPGTVGIADLRGSATYTGGAAGKYSLRGDTGGTNDAGHFTADVTLEATFAETHSIEGTVDNFIGADGESRDWSVALGKSVIADGGGITGGLAADGTPDGANTGNQMTTWTIGETASDAAGQWSGDLREQGDDGVPAIATGTFHSTYGQNGNDGRMVGAFGANN